MDGGPSKTMDLNTVAAMPGGLRVSVDRYARYVGGSKPNQWLLRACARLPWAARFLPMVGARVVQWTRTKEHLMFGCLAPAIIIDPEAGLVAVFTSLTAEGEVPTPVVKIVRERLDMIDPRLATRGTRLAAASVYWSTPESMARGCWSDFSPIVVDCLVDDTSSCEAARARIKPLAWKVLDLALAKLGDVRRPGLYPVDVPLDMAWDAF